jgi:hypothetical protein
MDDDLPALPATPSGRYRHYKGGSESVEPLVLYRALYGDSGLWVRPHAMFFEDVVIAGRVQPRFARIDGAATAA